MIETIKYALLPSKLYGGPFQSNGSLTSILYIKANTVVRLSANTITSNIVYTGVGGICSLIVGIRATKDTNKSETETILSLRSGV